ncbi:MAG: hypothetical protein ACJAR1_001178 [Rubritalea sp.]|jgi:hypothetical protein
MMKMNKQRKTTMSLAAATIALAGTAAHGASTVYEPFANSDASLTGNATGTGLTGNWAGDGRVDILSTNLTYGSLETSGNTAFTDGSWHANQANIDTTAGYNGLLADSGEMWFSMLYRKDVGNGRFYFSISDGGMSNNGNLGTGVTGIGFGSTGSNLYAGLWETNAWGASNLGGPAASSVDVSGDMTVNSGDSGSLAGVTTYLIVGHAQWGANGTADDTVTLYLPGTDLALGSAVAQSVGVVAQSGFDKINTNHGNGLSSRWDELRIGATYADVTPVPEPTTTALLGLGGLALILRRRK